jgi:hypothetical protein
MSLFFATIVTLLTATALTPAYAAEGDKGEGPDTWQKLFNGRNLLGWQKLGGEAHFRVEDGQIIGRTVPNTPNTFLCTKQTFDDFVLTFEVKLDNNELDSGVQIRSYWNKDKQRVTGPQAQIIASAPAEVASTPGWAGYIYGEATGRRWLSKNRQQHEAFKNGQWNRYRIKAQGPRTQTWINGQKVADLVDEQASREGFIGLQIHRVQPNQGPYQARWRDIRIRPLN